ncbi:hypothetical protein [Cardinium endosymbiont of Culicoides punctatus]|uniref:hypothetical protein n=1 Tax=Cardinium endosymbiont of Culicoides punctatus TaxID=2304601 RepID=UPI001058E5AF|nr:hypothetical protein [Cardinium endosymbiont of Culicoides punctatus]
MGLPGGITVTDEAESSSSYQSTTQDRVTERTDDVCEEELFLHKVNITPEKNESRTRQNGQHIPSYFFSTPQTSTTTYDDEVFYDATDIPSETNTHHLRRSSTPSYAGPSTPQPCDSSSDSKEFTEIQDSVSDFITSYLSHCSPDKVADFNSSIAPLLQEKCTKLSPEQQGPLLNYFAETGHFYPDLFKEHPADKWLLLSLIQDISFLCTEEERTTDLPQFSEKCHEICTTYTDNELYIILNFLRRQKQIGACSLSQLTEALVYLPPNESTVVVQIYDGISI